MEMIIKNAWHDFLMILIIILVIGIAANILYQLVLGCLSMIFGETIAYGIRNRWTLIGVIHHELAHALFAVITGAKVIQIQLFPSKDGKLGFVKFQMRGPRVLQALQQTMTSIAPVVCGCISLLVLVWIEQYHCTLWWHYGIAIFLQINLVLHMNMSSQDMKHVFQGLPICLGLLFFILCMINGYEIL